MGGGRISGGVALACVALSSPAWAQPAPPSPPSAPPGEAEAPAPAPPPAPAVDPKKEKAKELFLAGNRLRKAGDCQRAAELYRKSRRLVTTMGNTRNEAVCLRKLGRIDEALDLYGLLLERFADRLSPSVPSAAVTGGRFCSLPPESLHC